MFIISIHISRYPLTILTLSFIIYFCLFPLHQQPSATMSYKAGIFAAITELKDRTGSSSIAIKKHMQANLPADKKWMNATFLSALKKAVADGDLVQTKASYKLSPAYKAKAKKASKPKKAAPKKKTAPKKKAVSGCV